MQHTRAAAVTPSDHAHFTVCMSRLLLLQCVRHPRALDDCAWPGYLVLHLQ